jgi:hypothetical protein
MKKRPTIPIQTPPGQKTILCLFEHGGAFYEVRLQVIEGSRFATLHLAGTSCERPLHPFPDEVPAGLSRQAVEAGYVAVAQWLVKTGRWPDPETKTQEDVIAKAA